MARNIERRVLGKVKRSGAAGATGFEEGLV